tara:strand:+ start:72 stop:566 length:495 start_codon:yes stop_codon:yes gene_type:complete
MSANFTGFNQEVYTDPQLGYDAFTAFNAEIADKYYWDDYIRDEYQGQIDAALATAKEADSWALWAWNPETNLQAQADVFWAELIDYVATWDAMGSDDIRRVLGQAAVTLESVHEEIAANDLGEQVAGAAELTGEQVTDAVTDPTNWLLVGGIALAVLFVALKVK